MLYNFSQYWRKNTSQINWKYFSKTFIALKLAHNPLRILFFRPRLPMPAASGANAPGGRFSGRLNIPAPQPRPFDRYCLLFGGEARLSRVHFYVGNARGPVFRFKRKPRRISADFFGEAHFKAFFFTAAAYNKGPLFAAF